MAFCISLRILRLYFRQLIFHYFCLSCFRKGKREKLSHLWAVLSPRIFCATFSADQTITGSWRHRPAHRHQCLYRSQLRSIGTVLSLLCPTPAWSPRQSARPGLKSRRASRKSQPRLSAYTHRGRSCVYSSRLWRFYRHLTSQIRVSVKEKVKSCLLFGTYPHSPSTTILKIICLLLKFWVFSR